MQQRLISILDRLKAMGAEGLTGSIVDYRASGGHAFELQTDLPGKTFLTYEIGGDNEILRIEIMSGLGYLDLARTNNPTEFLVQLLEENVPSFRTSGACLGIKRDSNRLILILSSSHQFVATMSDEDIAEALSVTIFDLKVAQLFEVPDPIIMWQR